jgi:hypothetical protein
LFSQQINNEVALNTDGINMKVYRGHYYCTFIIMLVLSGTSIAQIRLPKLISDGMVLQRNAKVKLWGWAAAGEKVSVQFINKTYKAVTGVDGKWNIILPEIKAGGPYEMKITGSNSITIKDMLIGDVWVCSGQLKEFAIAGADKVFVQAKAKIEGDKVIVWNDELPNPMYVRYAWADSPPYPNLHNKEGLPASPFRTDGF